MEDYTIFSDVDFICNICQKQYDNYKIIPRMMPDCGHSYCEQCILNLIDEFNKNGKTIICPEDR